MQLIELKEKERMVLPDKFKAEDNVLYTNTGFFKKKVGYVTQVKKYKSRQTMVYVRTADEKVIYRSPKNLEFKIN